MKEITKFLSSVRTERRRVRSRRNDKRFGFLAVIVYHLYLHAVGVQLVAYVAAFAAMEKLLEIGFRFLREYYFRHVFRVDSIHYAVKIGLIRFFFGGLETGIYARIHRVNRCVFLRDRQYVHGIDFRSAAHEHALARGTHRVARKMYHGFGEEIFGLYLGADANVERFSHAVTVIIDVIVTHTVEIIHQLVIGYGKRDTLIGDRDVVFVSRPVVVLLDESASHRASGEHRRDQKNSK